MTWQEVLELLRSGRWHELPPLMGAGVEATGGVSPLIGLGPKSLTEIAQGTVLYAPPAGISTLIVECIGGGGGGAGCGTAAATSGAGGGGGGGGYALVIVPKPLKVNYVVQVGAGGNGGAAGANAGTDGTASTFDNPSICTANPGGLAPAPTAVGTVVFNQGGVGGFPAGPGNLVLGGDPGGPGIIGSATTSIGGHGGMAARGGGGPRGVNTNAGGGGGRQWGGGGGGGAQQNNGGNQAGGPGSNGRILVWEFA